MDVSETSYGVALLNDCKYGYSVQDGALALTLLRSPSYPDPAADRAMHEFTYALLPHAGDCAAGGVVREAYALNAPLRVALGAAPLPSLLRVDAENVMVDTVKKAEDGDALIVRLYEAHGAAASVTISFGFTPSAVFRVDLMEEDPQPLELAGTGISFPVTPFEIVTLRVETAENM